MNNEFKVGKLRRSIEDRILVQFHQVDLQAKQHGYLEQENFWDFIFSWYDLVKYYEDSGDNTLGASMLDLFVECSQLFRLAASDGSLSERRRDKAADALYQLTYSVNQIAIQVQRNGLEQASEIGDIRWQHPQDQSYLN